MMAGSIRWLWNMYKDKLVQSDKLTRRDLVMVKRGFFAGARSVYEILDDMLEYDDWEEIRRVVERQMRQIRAMSGEGPKGRWN